MAQIPINRRWQEWQNTPTAPRRQTIFNSQPHNGWVWIALVLALLVFVPVLRWVAHTSNPIFVSKPAFPMTAVKSSDSSSSISAETNSASRHPIVRDTDSSPNDSRGTTSPLRLADTQRTAKVHSSASSTSGTPSRKMFSGARHESAHKRSDLPKPTPYRGPVRTGQGATIRAYSDEIPSTETTDDNEPKPYRGPLRSAQAKPGEERQQESRVQYNRHFNSEVHNQEPYRGRLR